MPTITQVCRGRLMSISLPIRIEKSLKESLANTKDPVLVILPEWTKMLWSIEHYGKPISERFYSCFNLPVMFQHDYNGHGLVKSNDQLTAKENVFYNQIKDRFLTKPVLK